MQPGRERRAARPLRRIDSSHCGWLPSERKLPQVERDRRRHEDEHHLAIGRAASSTARASASARTSVTYVRHSRRGHGSPATRAGLPGSGPRRDASGSARPVGPPALLGREPSARRERAAVDVHGRAGHELRELRREEQRDARDVGAAARTGRAAPTWGSGARRRGRPTCEYGTCSVSVTSGAIAFTRTPSRAYSTASERVNPVIAALNAE